MDWEEQKEVGMASNMNGAIRSIVLGRKERIDEGQQVEAGKGHGDSYPDELMRSMVPTNKAEEMKTGYTSAKVKMDTKGVEGGWNKECRSLGQTESGGDFRLCEETAAKLEAKVREDEEQQSDEESAQ